MDQVERLRRAADFARVFARGRRVANALAVLYFCPSGEAQTRIGFAVGRRLGGAVVRNRLRRRWREAVRQAEIHVRPGFDVVVVARAPGMKADFKELQAAWQGLLQRAGLGTTGK